MKKNGCDIRIGSVKKQFESDFCFVFISDNIFVREGDLNKMIFFNCHLFSGCNIVYMMKTIRVINSFSIIYLQESVMLPLAVQYF